MVGVVSLPPDTSHYSRYCVKPFLRYMASGPGKFVRRRLLEVLPLQAGSAFGTRVARRRIASAAVLAVDDLADRL
jgi:hypothetical protein